jgi:hypothetical protein
MEFFGEGMGMIVFASRKSDEHKIKSLLKDARIIGSVRNDNRLCFGTEEMTLTEAMSAYRGDL